MIFKQVDSLEMFLDSLITLKQISAYDIFINTDMFITVTTDKPIVIDNPGNIELIVKNIQVNKITWENGDKYLLKVTEPIEDVNASFTTESYPHFYDCVVFDFRFSDPSLLSIKGSLDYLCDLKRIKHTGENIKFKDYSFFNYDQRAYFVGCGYKNTWEYLIKLAMIELDILKLIEEAKKLKSLVIFLLDERFSEINSKVLKYCSSVYMYNKRYSNVSDYYECQAKR